MTILEFGRRAATLLRRRRLEQDLHDEVAFHLAMREAGGASAHQAQRRFGNVTRMTEEMRDVWTFPSFESVGRDIRYAVRSLRRQPGFALTVTLVLAAAIGLNTSLSTLAAGLILRPWPGVFDPSRVVAIYLPHSKGPAAGRFGFSVTDYRSLAKQARSFDGLAVMSPDEVRLDTDRGAGKALFVSGNLFDVLGVRMAIGRGFRQDEDRTGSPQPVAVLSYGFWQAQYGGDPSVIGRIVRLNDVPFTVVGVAPREFSASEYLFQVNVLVPVPTIDLLRPGTRGASAFQHSSRFCCADVIGRLKPGVVREQARAEVEVISASFESQEGAQARGVVVAGTEFTSHPGRAVIRAALAIVSAALMLVWLMACANIGNLLLARAAARRREIGVRLSMGASRARILRQLFTEAAVLALAASALGTLLASYLPTIVLRLLANDASLSFPFDVRPDGVILIHALVLAGLSAAVFGLAPALHATRASVVQALNDRDVVTAAPVTLRSALLAFQVAVSVILLVSASLLVRGVQKQSGTFDPGFPIADVAVVAFDPPPGTYDDGRARTFVASLTESLQALPGGAFAFASQEPFSLARSVSSFRLPGQPPSDEPTLISYVEVSPDYFETLRIPVLSGRRFTRADAGGSAVLVNETMARYFWPDGDVVGRTFVTGGVQTREIVGVVRDVHSNVFETIQPLFYQPLAAGRGGVLPKLLVRGGGAGSVAAVEQAVRQVDPRLRTRTSRLPDLLEAQLEASKWGPLLAGVLGGFALVLATVGMFGVFAYVVRQRTRELGIRVALGASSAAVVRLVLVGHSRAVAAGLFVGLLGAIAASMLLRNQLHGVSPFDPIAYLGVAALLGVAGAAASYLPARRATRINPIEALRCD